MSSATPAGLEQHIAQLEAQLAQLKKDKALLQDLAARKEELQKELQRINGQISRLTSKVAPPPPSNAAPAPKPPAAAKPTPTPAKPVPTPAKPAAPAAAPTAAAGPRLADLIVACLKEARGKPLTVRQLTDQTQKRGFTTSSSSPYKMVESRVQDLSKKGVVARAKDQPGWVLKNAPAPAANGAAAAKKANGADKPPLREHVVNVLKRSKRPLSLKVLSEKILADGYQTGSSDFANVLGVALKKMADVKRIPGEGYTLKAAKG
jgi:uncharacterized coiled-coil protein SlyX